MKATAHRVAAPRSAKTTSSARGLEPPGGTIRSRRGTWGRRRPRAKTSTIVATSQRQSAFTIGPSRLDPPSDQDADGHERGRGQQPGDEPFRDRPDVAERPAAAVLRMLGLLDVGDERAQLLVGDL